MGQFLFRSFGVKAQPIITKTEPVAAEVKTAVKDVVQPKAVEKAVEKVDKKETGGIATDGRRRVMFRNVATKDEAQKLRDSMEGAIIYPGAKGRFLVFRPK